MQASDLASITECSWQNSRDELHTVNSELAKIIDSCQTTQALPLYLARLPFGQHLLADGTLQLPLKQTFTTGAALPDAANAFCAVMLKGSVETFHQFAERIAPIHTYLPGAIIGLDTLKLFNQQYNVASSYHATAGARSLFMLPKITDSASHKNIQREFNIRTGTPKKLSQHWDVFRQIAAHSASSNTPTWETQCLILPTTALCPSNTAYHPLQHYLSRCAHRASEYWRHQYLWDLTFSRIKSLRNLKPNPYLADTCKHLFAIGVGAVPGFTAAIDDQLAPTALLQQVYLDIYGLKHYAPVLMQPQHYHAHLPQTPVYYSLQLPTLLEFSPKSRNLSSTISDLREVKHITSTYLTALQQMDLGVRETPIQRFAEKAAFSFYHSEEDSYGEIQVSQRLLTMDARWQQAHAALSAQGFSENSPFVRGCIRIG